MAERKGDEMYTHAGGGLADVKLSLADAAIKGPNLEGGSGGIGLGAGILAKVLGWAKDGLGALFAKKGVETASKSVLSKVAGGALKVTAGAAVGTASYIGLQKIIPKSKGGGYVDDVVNDIRDYAIAGTSGAAGGGVVAKVPGALLGASVGIASQIAEKTYKVGKEAVETVNFINESKKAITESNETMKKHRELMGQISALRTSLYNHPEPLTFQPLRKGETIKPEVNQASKQTSISKI